MMNNDDSNNDIYYLAEICLNLAALIEYRVVPKTSLNYTKRLCEDILKRRVPTNNS